MSGLTAAAGVRGYQTRQARAKLKHDMAAGRVRWEDVLTDPPPCVHGLLLIELLLMMPGVRRARVESLGRRAFVDGIVLTGRCDRTSALTRAWLRENLLHRSSGHSARSRGSRARTGRRTGVLLP